MQYEIIGTGAAPSFFYIGNNGRILTRGQLRTDRALTYVVSIKKLYNECDNSDLFKHKVDLFIY